MVRKRFFLGILVIGIFFLCFSMASAEVTETCFSEDWEYGQGDWDIDNGVWEVGTPTAGPGAAHSGSQCAGTVLDGDYPGDTDSRIISPPFRVCEAIGNEEIHLRFWHWFSYSSYDAGYVQVSVWDDSTNAWLPWENVGNSIWDTSPV